MRPRKVFYWLKIGVKKHFLELKQDFQAAVMASDIAAVAVVVAAIMLLIRNHELHKNRFYKTKVKQDNREETNPLQFSCVLRR